MEAVRKVQLHQVNHWLMADGTGPLQPCNLRKRDGAGQPTPVGHTPTRGLRLVLDGVARNEGPNPAYRDQDAAQTTGEEAQDS